MNSAPLEITSIEESIQVQPEGLRELSELQLALVGGGSGEVVFG